MNLAAGAVLACLVFAAMGMTQLHLRFEPRKEPDRLLDFHLPPPPPPPPQVEKPAEKRVVPLSFDLPVTGEPAVVPLGFLEVDFGLTAKKLTETDFDVESAISSFQQEELEDLSVYDESEVSEKPVRTYTPPLSIPREQMSGNADRFRFGVIARISREGRPTDVHIIDCPHPEAVPVLRAWVLGMQFKPARRDGKAVNCLVHVFITYRTSAGSSSPFSL